MKFGLTTRWVQRRRLLLVAGLLVLIVLLDLLLPPPIPSPMARASTLVLARDGAPLRAFVSDDGVWRYPVTPADVSPLYVEALLGYEDRWFFQHPGVNPLALIRAVFQAVRHGEVISGGSTLTMQVARLIEPIPRHAGGKLKQIIRALQIERRLTKAQILMLYLERAPFGGTVEGVEAASWAYLGKPSKQLSRAEAAMLAVLPQAPSRLRPDRHPQAARQARDKVLDRLRRQGQWPAHALSEAVQEPVVSRRLKPPMLAALFAERLRQEHADARVLRSTIDVELQRLLESRLAAEVTRLPARSSAAVLLVHNGTREVLAYVGSARFADEERLGHVDMIRAIRSPGSTLKPFLYGLALDAGLVHSASLMVDAPQAFDGYRPANFGDFFHGPVTVADALRRSLNVPAVELLQQVTPARFTARLRHAGVRLVLPRAAVPNLSIILGGTGTRLDQIAGAYTAFGNSGVGGPVRLLLDEPKQDREILSPGAAWIVRDILETHSLPDQLASGMVNDVRLAWKTGTSYGYRDAWAFGVTPAYTIGVWTGRPDGTPMPGQYGAVTALPMLVNILRALPRSAADRTPSTPPASVSSKEICWPTGLPEVDERAPLCQVRQTAWLLDNNLPPTHVSQRGDDLPLVGVVAIEEKTGRRVPPHCATETTRNVQIARWPLLASPWLTAEQKRRSALPALKAGCEEPVGAVRSLHIDGIVPGAILRSAPGSGRAPLLQLKARGATGRVYWLVNDKLAGLSDDEGSFELSLPDIGTQAILAIDGGGQFDRLSVQVVQ